MEVGFRAIGLDIGPEKPRKIYKGESYIEHFSDTAVQQAVKDCSETTTDFSRAKDSDALILCVPTPLDDQLESDLGFIIDTMDSLPLT